MQFKMETKSWCYGVAMDEVVMFLMQRQQPCLGEQARAQALTTSWELLEKCKRTNCISGVYVLAKIIGDFYCESYMQYKDKAYLQHAEMYYEMAKKQYEGWVKDTHDHVLLHSYDVLRKLSECLQHELQEMQVKDRVDPEEVSFNTDRAVAMNVKTTKLEGVHRKGATRPYTVSVSGKHCSTCKEICEKTIQDVDNLYYCLPCYKAYYEEWVKEDELPGMVEDTLVSNPASEHMYATKKYNNFAQKNEDVDISSGYESNERSSVPEEEKKDSWVKLVDKENDSIVEDVALNSLVPNVDVDAAVEKNAKVVISPLTYKQDELIPNPQTPIQSLDCQAREEVLSRQSGPSTNAATEDVKFVNSSVKYQREHLLSIRCSTPQVSIQLLDDQANEEILTDLSGLSKNAAQANAVVLKAPLSYNRDELLSIRCLSTQSSIQLLDSQASEEILVKSSEAKGPKVKALPQKVEACKQSPAYKPKNTQARSFQELCGWALQAP